MVSRSGKISIAGSVLFVTAILYLFLPVYSATIENFTFSCSIITMLIKGGFTGASFLQVIQYFLPMVILIVAGCFAVGGKFKYKYVIVGLCVAAIAALCWIFFDLSLVEELLSQYNFGNVTVKDGTGIGLFVSLLLILWAGFTVFFAKGRNTF